MPSRLSSLLVRDGLVGVKRMEKAFQRQVIYGGSLDTILLEMGLVPEERLTQYLALASGLPPAARDEGAELDPAALALVPRDLAEQYRAVPVAFEGDAIRAVVCAPLELTELEDLADLLDRPLQPLITPEYRWNLIFATAYQLDPPARFTTLARSLEVDPAISPVGRAASVIIDSPGAMAAAALAQDFGDPTPVPTGEPSLPLAAVRVARSSEVPSGAVTSAVASPDSGAVTQAAPRAGASVLGATERPRTVPPFGDVPRLAPVPLDAETLKLLASDPAGRASPVVHEEIARGRRPTMMGVVPNRAQTDTGMLSGRGDDDDTPPLGTRATPPVGHRAVTASQMSQLSQLGAPSPASPTSISSAPVRLPGLTPAPPRPASGPTPVPHSGAIPVTQSGPIPTTITPSGVIPTVPGSGGTGRAGSRTSAQMRALGPATRPTPISTGGRDAPLPVVRARELLAAATDRDTVFLTLLRAARSRARWAGLLTVQGGAALGRVALAEHGLDATAVNTVLIPLDAVSPFRTVVSNHQSHIGPLVSGDPSIDSMMLRMGGTMPPSALIMPVVLRERVVALVVAHRVDSDLKLVDVTELLPIANAASEAIGRLIVQSKASGRATTETGGEPVHAIHHEPSARTAQPAAPLVEFEAVDTKRLSRTPTSQRAQSSPGFEQGVEMSIEAGEPQPIDEVLDDIERAKEGGAEHAFVEAVERATETVRALARRFPGKLRVDRFAVSGRPLRAAQYGGLLDLVIRLGTTSTELLVEKMSAASRDIRFYATVCAAELRPRLAVFALAERLFDQDFGVRASAIEALSGYSPPELGHALLRARRAVHSSDPDVVAAASGALVALGDTEAIPDLIGVIERSDRGGEHARKALSALTAQDFGASERKWRKWYESARKRHRIEWLIEGLGHKEDAIRESAIEALRRLTGEYFGYHHDLPRKERDAAAERWAAWWRDAGHRRFAVVLDADRHRSTVELPLTAAPSPRGSDS